MASSSHNDTESPSWANGVDTKVHEVLDTITVERNKLEEDRKAFEKEKLAWNIAESKLEVSQLGESVLLDVGGTSFACSIELLQKIPDTYFSNLVSGRWELKRQKDGSLFIDRDPAVFSLIMTYMRKYGTGFDIAKWIRSLPNQEKMLLQDEADFYLLTDLMQLMIPNSAILDEEAWKSIHPSFEKRKLLYTSCDPNTTFLGAVPEMKGKSNMLVVAITETGAILGAFTSVAWQFSGTWHHDATAFLFCQDFGKDLTKHQITKGNANWAVCMKRTFLAFGDGRDLYFSIPGRNTQCMTVYYTPSSYSALPIEAKQNARKNVEFLEIWSLE